MGNLCRVPRRQQGDQNEGRPNTWPDGPGLAPPGLGKDARTSGCAKTFLSVAAGGLSRAAYPWPRPRFRFPAVAAYRLLSAGVAAVLAAPGVAR
jgi:hypothetical protein